MNRYIVYLVLVGCALLGAFGQIGFKKGMDALQFDRLFETLNIWLIGGILCYGISLILFLVMLKQVNLSIAYPIIALTYPLVMVLSAVMLGEKITSLKLIGSFGILLSVGLIMWQGAG